MAETSPLILVIDDDPEVRRLLAGGLSVREILSVLDRMDTPIIGADVVEYNPTRDINGVTAVVAGKFVKELAGIAARS